MTWCCACNREYLSGHVCELSGWPLCAHGVKITSNNKGATRSGWCHECRRETGRAAQAARAKMRTGE